MATKKRIQCSHFVATQESGTHKIAGILGVLWVLILENYYSHSMVAGGLEVIS